MKRKYEGGSSGRRFLAWALAAVTALFPGCVGQRNMHSLQKEPNFAGIVTQVWEYSVQVEVNEGEDALRSSDLINVSLDAELSDSITHFDVGDEIRVYYDGSIAESYPAQVVTVYAIVLVNPADTQEIIAEALTQAGFTVENMEDSSSLFTEKCIRLFLNGSRDQQVTLYSFGDHEETSKAAEGISDDGFQIASKGSMSSVDWIAPPHFYRHGSCIVQYVGTDETVLKALREVCSETYVE